MSATRTVTTDGTGTLTVGGVISGTGFGLIKVGAGTLRLTAQNLYTGGTIVDAGTLLLGIGGGIGTIRGVLTISSGATVVMTAVDAIGSAFREAFLDRYERGTPEPP